MFYTFNYFNILILLLYLLCFCHMVLSSVACESRWWKRKQFQIRRSKILENPKPERADHFVRRTLSLVRCSTGIMQIYNVNSLLVAFYTNVTQKLGGKRHKNEE